MPTTLVDDLRADIARGHVICIVGLGASAAATHDPARRPDPITWRGLLELGVAECEKLGVAPHATWAATQRTLLASPDLDEMLSAAEHIAGKLGAEHGGGDYGRWLRESFKGIPIRDRAVPEALVALGVPLLTTNYDDVLERVNGLPACTWRDTADVERVLRGDDRAIVHLHGVYQRPDTVVLGVRSYQRLLQDTTAQAFQRAFRALRTLLFVGVGQGLDDPNLGSLIAWSRDVFKGSETRHYLLCRSGERAAIQSKHPLSERLFAVAYGDDYGDLAPFLRGLI
ncbi:Hypothetical protein A7982_08813 [Minicystis rosea]|nr:Hypothetical protein A7982_08813 [Minicystis rosea]